MVEKFSIDSAEKSNFLKFPMTAEESVESNNNTSTCVSNVPLVKTDVEATTKTPLSNRTQSGPMDETTKVARVSGPTTESNEDVVELKTELEQPKQLGTELTKQRCEHKEEEEIIKGLEEWKNDEKLSKECYDVEKSSLSPKINLQKIFTPATDAEEILPRNRKLYASSAFYSPTLHPTVEDQVELARRISHSLSDVSNQLSKGQSMYVNRKKRSVKWVHEGPSVAKLDSSTNDLKCEEKTKENTDPNDASEATTTTNGQLPLRLVMNPRGKIQDFNSASDNFNIEMGLMSPDKCAELVTALKTQHDKGAELFAKRRRKAEKWVVDETNAATKCPSGLPDYHQYQPKIENKLAEKYITIDLPVLKTPWEKDGLETAPQDAAANIDNDEISSLLSKYKQTNSENFNATQSSITSESENDCRKTLQQDEHSFQMPWNKVVTPTTCNRQRNLAYRPNIPQGWKAPSLTLSSELYVPKEIPLDSYAPPPPIPIIHQSGGSRFDHSIGDTTSPPPHTSQPITNSSNTVSTFNNSLYLNSNNNNNSSNPAPLSQKYKSCPLSNHQSLENNIIAYDPPTQRLTSPNSYQTVPQETKSQPKVNFNPSPLPYEKLAMFENPSPPYSDSNSIVYNPSTYNVRSPLAPYTSQANRSYSPVLQSLCSPCGKEQQQTRYNTANFRNFNNSVRGWSAGNTKNRNKQSLEITATMPYTDF